MVKDFVSAILDFFKNENSNMADFWWGIGTFTQEISQAPHSNVLLAFEQALTVSTILDIASLLVSNCRNRLKNKIDPTLPRCDSNLSCE